MKNNIDIYLSAYKNFIALNYGKQMIDYIDRQIRKGNYETPEINDANYYELPEYR